jgi:hypothetical protein
VWGDVEPYFGPEYHLSGPITIGVVMSYYALFEIIPCVVILYYYRRLPPRPASFPPSMFNEDFDNPSPGINASGSHTSSDGLRRNLL